VDQGSHTKKLSVVLVRHFCHTVGVVGSTGPDNTKKRPNEQHAPRFAKFSPRACRPLGQAARASCIFAATYEKNIGIGSVLVLNESILALDWF
jgi:hypothetical protein